MCAWIKKLVFDRIAFMALFAFCLLVHLLSIVQSCLFSSGRTQESASTEETPGNASGSQLRRLPPTHALSVPNVHTREGTVPNLSKVKTAHTLAGVFRQLHT